MKCQICCRRKAIHEVRLWEQDLRICEPCRRISLPTPEEQEQDADAEEQRCELQAENDALHYLNGGW